MDAADSPEVVTAKRLLDEAKRSGFTFRRAAQGADPPLVGNRVIDDWADLIRIEGFSRDCFAWRQRTSSLIVSPGALVQYQVEGGGARGALRGVELEVELMSWPPIPRSPTGSRWSEHPRRSAPGGQPVTSSQITNDEGRTVGEGKDDNENDKADRGKDDQGGQHRAEDKPTTRAGIVRVPPTEPPSKHDR